MELIIETILLFLLWLDRRWAEYFAVPRRALVGDEKSNRAARCCNLPALKWFLPPVLLTWRVEFWPACRIKMGGENRTVIWNMHETSQAAEINSHSSKQTQAYVSRSCYSCTVSIQLHYWSSRSTALGLCVRKALPVTKVGRSYCKHSLGAIPNWS